jgi:hypothetical protein
MIGPFFFTIFQTEPEKIVLRGDFGRKQLFHQTIIVGLATPGF